LEIDSILLNVYKTGTAVLSFHLRNHKHPAKGDVLKINKFGRRLYVPFFDLEPESIFTGKPDKTGKDKILCAVKKYEIPDKIWIGDIDISKSNSNLVEDFEKYKDRVNYQCNPFLLPKFIDGLFPENFFQVSKCIKNADLDRQVNRKIQISPVLDDRMHVVCWYGNTELVNKLNQIKKCNDFDLGRDYLNDNRGEKNHYSFETEDWWYCYIFNDSGMPMHTDRFLKQKLLKENTYSRWVELGTLYGISRFSFVMLTSSFSELTKYDTTYLVRHLQTMYYKMAELCLLQRATVLSYSDEVTHVSNLLNKEKEVESIQRISDLYKHYILFVNKIYFREVTAQEQGIEIYDMMQRVMRIPSDVKDLDNEIDELNRFASMIAEKNETEDTHKLTKEAHYLSKAATIFLIPTLLASLLGMNVLPDFIYIPTFLISRNPVWPFWTSFVFIVIVTVLGYYAIMKFVFKKNKKSNKKSEEI
jgi:Mg2+ and Co2+ transporter CorA